MDIGFILKIGVIGILIVVLDRFLDTAGKKEQGTMVTLAGLVVVLGLVIYRLAGLLDSVTTLFHF